MNLSPTEAAQALATIEASRRAMRGAIRAHRGHAHLWLWGAVWIAMALLAQLRGPAGLRLFPWLVLGGMIGSCALGAVQSSQIRLPIDWRFLRVLAAVLGFAALGPLVLRGASSNQALFAYIALVAMLCYVIAGIWFDSYLLWLGLAVAALIVIGLLWFPALFWWWIAVFGGGTLIGTGCYIRFCWR